MAQATARVMMDSTFIQGLIVVRHVVKVVEYVTVRQIVQHVMILQFKILHQMEFVFAHLQKFSTLRRTLAKIVEVVAVFAQMRVHALLVIQQMVTLFQPEEIVIVLLGNMTMVLNV
jgi:hypothetical protein